MKVAPEYIMAQRELGWPDMHPEDNCHLCGEDNPIWGVAREHWLAATSRWAASTGREGILCPNCFAAMYRQETGSDPSWLLSIEVP